MTILVICCLVAGALYLEKLAHEWHNTPAAEPVNAGYGNWLLVLCLACAALGVLALAGCMIGGVAR
jgi:hypothetical protein